MKPRVVAVSRSAAHALSKSQEPSIRLVVGRGVQGDAHAGATVQHRSHVKRDPDRPNLRQVHLIHTELHAELAAAGFDVAAGQMGENVTTSGLDLLQLPVGTRLHLGRDAVVELTGLRNPCAQLDGLHPGLMAATLERTLDGALIRKAGVMAIVIRTGTVRTDDAIDVLLPPPPHEAMKPV